ncbi:hydantoinase/oxoprolinase family protein [Sneathiella sp.]|uniref:hydantoinase/oxoprolinase family protein n=1 Tax=Sneathiella sp. TaxID=1964365 RepID=UPI002606C79B|nr:hydantoinase/oxoprolinase family protein [Sneathiella sp.]MDF2368419.1 hydantoinase/oxoprolinase family protein [Sneathiella sp.]
MQRIGIDVGGTNTDAVLVDQDKVVGAVKTPTTRDVTGGVRKALEDLIALVGPEAKNASSVTIGTTHFLNAVVERRRLNKVAAVRISLPASASLPPFVDWPEDVAAIANGGHYMVRGGHEYDGREIVPLDEEELARVGRDIREAGITSVGISAVFSPLNAEFEERAREIIEAECPGVRITCSHSLGRLGLLERENATLLNAALLDLAEEATDAFQQALEQLGITAPLYIALNDGTVTNAEMTRKFPVYCFASGATNSMRGAAFLSKIENAIVCDVGGTTTDIGSLVNGFPREANSTVTVGGVRTLFRMPDLISIGIGGGTRVHDDPLDVGPDSVGFRLTEEARVFGGDQLTLTDVAVSKGLMEAGEASKIADLAPDYVDKVLAIVHERIASNVDRIKTEATEVPLIAVGGGAPLIPTEIPGISRVHHVENFAVANAVGAAIAQISGEADQVFQGLSRDEALAEALKIAEEKAISSGAAADSLKTIEMEDLPIAYIPGHAIRARVRVIGDIAALSGL